MAHDTKAKNGKESRSSPAHEHERTIACRIIDCRPQYRRRLRCFPKQAHGTYRPLRDGHSSPFGSSSRPRTVMVMTFFGCPRVDRTRRVFARGRMSFPPASPASTRPAAVRSFVVVVRRVSICRLAGCRRFSGAVAAAWCLVSTSDYREGYAMRRWRVDPCSPGAWPGLVSVESGVVIAGPDRPAGPIPHTS